MAVTRIAAAKENDGYYLMLAPLHAGRHTLHLFGRIPDYFGPGEDFVSEASYALLVE